MRISFFKKDNAIVLIGHVRHEGICFDFSEILPEGESVKGLAYEEFIKRGRGTLDIDEETSTARFVSHDQ